MAAHPSFIHGWRGALSKETKGSDCSVAYSSAARESYEEIGSLWHFKTSQLLPRVDLSVLEYSCDLLFQQVWTPLHLSAFAKLTLLVLQSSYLTLDAEEANHWIFPAPSDYDRGRTDVSRLIEILIAKNQLDPILRWALGNEYLWRKHYLKAKEAFDQFVEIGVQD